MIRAQHYGMIGRRRLVVVCLSSSKKGRLLGRNRLSVVKIAGSSGSAIDGPDSRVGPWGGLPTYPSVRDQAVRSIYLPLVDSNRQDQPLLGLSEKKAGEITWPGRRRKVPDSETRTRDPEAGTWKTEARDFISFTVVSRCLVGRSQMHLRSMRHCPHGGDMPELAESLMEKPEHRHKGAIWFHESCGGVYGSVPRNSERENLGEAKDQEDEEIE
ncbi:hypothetical protein YC2023_041965 [Brassica napus]